MITYRWNVDQKTKIIYYNDVEKVSVNEMYCEIVDMFDGMEYLEYEQPMIALTPELIEVLSPYKLHKHALHCLHSGTVLMQKEVWTEWKI
jgi:hypothetical protein